MLSFYNNVLFQILGNIFKESQQQENSTFYADFENHSETDLASVSTTSLSSVSDKTAENNSSCSSLSQTNDTNSASGQFLNIDSKYSRSNSSSSVISNGSIDNQSGSRTSKSNTGSWTLVDAKEFYDERSSENIQNAENKGQGHVSQGESQLGHGQGQNVPLKNKADIDFKAGKLMSTFSNLKKMKFGKRQISEPGTNSLMPGNTVYCSRCKMVGYKV